MVTKKGTRKKEKPQRVRVSRRELKFKNPFMTRGERPNKRLNMTYKAPIFNPNMSLGEEAMSNEKLNNLEQMQRKGLLSKDIDLTNLRSKLSSSMLPGGVQNVNARDRGTTIMREAERVTAGILSTKAAEEKKILEAAQKRKEEKSKRKAIAYLAETDELDQIPGELREEVNKWYHMGLPTYLFDEDERLLPEERIIARLLADERFRLPDDRIQSTRYTRIREGRVLERLKRISPSDVKGDITGIFEQYGDGFMRYPFMPSDYIHFLNPEGLYLVNLLKQNAVQNELNKRGDVKRRLDSKRKAKFSERNEEYTQRQGEDMRTFMDRVSNSLSARLRAMGDNERTAGIEDLVQNAIEAKKKESMPAPIAQAWNPGDTMQGSGGWKAPRLGNLLTTYETRETLEPTELPGEREDKVAQQLQGRRQMLREFYKEKRGKEPPRGMIERGMPKFVSPYEEKEERDEGNVIVLHPFVFGRKRKFHFDI